MKRLRDQRRPEDQRGPEMASRLREREGRERVGVEWEGRERVSLPPATSPTVRDRRMEGEEVEVEEVGEEEEERLN